MAQGKDQQHQELVTPQVQGIRSLKTGAPLNRGRGGGQLQCLECTILGGEQDVPSVGRSSLEEVLLGQGAELDTRELEIGVVDGVKTELLLGPVQPLAHMIL